MNCLHVQTHFNLPVLDAAHDGVNVCRHVIGRLTTSISDLHQHQLHVVDVVDATTQLIIEATVSLSTQSTQLSLDTPSSDVTHGYFSYGLHCVATTRASSKERGERDSRSVRRRKSDTKNTENA